MLLVILIIYVDDARFDIDRLVLKSVILSSLPKPNVLIGQITQPYMFPSNDRGKSKFNSLVAGIGV